MAPHKKYWVVEMAKNGGITEEEIAQMVKEMEIPRTD
jgi:hypothetical protein